MREFTKSLTSFSWAMATFGVQQTLNLFSGGEDSREHPATEAFNNVSKATTDELGGFTEAAFRAGNNIQQGLMGVMFEIFSSQGGDARCGSCGGTQATRQSSAAGRDSRRGDTRTRNGCGGCGSGR
ncbi:MAG: hypothetical protein H0T60_15985 [Acidobacteria bacterium]|nr:hypothetical protein [Acidobacteriota bacterium]